MIYIIFSIAKIKKKILKNLLNLSKNLFILSILAKRRVILLYYFTNIKFIQLILFGLSVLLFAKIFNIDFFSKSQNQYKFSESKQVRYEEILLCIISFISVYFACKKSTISKKIIIFILILFCGKYLFYISIMTILFLVKILIKSFAILVMITSVKSLWNKIRNKIYNFRECFQLASN